MTDAEDDKGEDTVLAGEYALHLMEPSDRRAFEARLAREPALRALLREWEESLAPLAEAVPPVPPPPGLKARIEARLFADDPAPARRGWAERLFGGALAAAALAILLVTFVPLMLPAPEPAYQARIAAEDGSLVLRASLDAGGRALSVERVQGAAAPGRVLELWLIAEGAGAPVSLGVLPEAQATTIALSAELARAIPGATLAISDEPPGGSPTGQPTGAVLAAGPIAAL